MDKSYSHFLSLQIMLREGTMLLRQIFLQTWKELYQKDWTDDVEASKYFRNGPGKEIRDSCKKIQQISLDSGNSGEWDITLLGTVLTSKLFTQVLKKRSYLQPVSKISSVRNKINHLASLEIEDVKFVELSNELISAMTALGASREYVLKLKDNIAFHSESLVTNSDQKAQSVKESANEEFKKKNYVKAIEIYTSAINLPNLTNQELGILYRNRSLSYSKLYDETKDEINLYRALIDAEKTCSHHPVWFKGYAQLGEIYCKMNKFNKAVQCYEKALAFSFNSEEMRNSLGFMKAKLGDQQRYDHLNQYPLSTEEHEEQFFQKSKERFSGNIENLNLSDIKKKVFESDPTLKIISIGHEYRDGSKTVKQDYEMAAKFYSKAAQKNNAEGMYNLALLLMKGLGVKADFKAAIALLKDAAKEKPTRQLLGQEIINVGVCEAEHSLGLAYEEGIYVAKDDRKASKWYQSAVEHGSGNSANNLGVMYLHGTGVKKNIKEAERLFILAHERGDINASGNLVDLYILEGDPDRALIWHERSLQTLNIFPKIRDGEIRKKIQSLKNVEQLKDSLPYDQRVAIESVLKYTHKFINSLEVPSVIRHKSFNFNTEELINHAKNGSITANEMVKACVLFYEALSMLTIRNFKVKDFLIKLESAYSTYQIICRMPIDKYEEVSKIINSAIQESQNQKCEIDYYARLCFAYLNLSDHKLLINFLECSLLIYPDDCKMLHLLGCHHAFLNQHENALNAFEKAYSLQPSNYEYIYSKAVALRLLGNKNAKDFYEKFISAAPADHRKLPESYYALGVISCIPGSSMELSKISFYFNKGIESEKLQLSCFLPYESTSKEVLEQLCMITETKSKTVLLEKIKEINIKESDEYIDYKRKEVFLNHRKVFKTLKSLKMFKKNSLEIHQGSCKPNKYQTMPSSVIGLKTVYLKDIDFSKDYILTGHALTVTSVDIPIIGVFSSVHFVVEDEKCFVEKLCIYNLGEDYQSIKEKFPIGCIFTIINPYARLAAHGKSMIRVDDPNTVIMSEKRKIDMCFYCGKEQSRYTCSRCKAAKYCSKECQNNDWKMLNHIDVCDFASSL